VGQETSLKRNLPVWLWFLALGLLVAGPLLGGGYLLLLDFPSGPRFPQVPVFPLPSSGDVGNALPLLALHALLRSISPLLSDKLFLVVPIVMGGIGVFHFARSRLGVGSLPALYGATLFVVNPFVVDRYLAGHLYFLLAYSLLPWALAPIYDALGGDVRSAAPRMAMWLAGFGAIDVHVAGLYALVALIAAAAASARRVMLAAVTLGLGAALAAYWLLPALFSTPGAGIGPADLAVYASRPRGPAVIASLLSMHGFWRDEFPSLAQHFPALYLLMIPLFAVSVAGAARLVAGKSERRFGVALIGAAVLALFLAAGTSFPPTAGAFRWLFDHVPFFGVYREPQKFLALVVLSYAVFGAVGLHDLLADLGRGIISLGTTVLAVAAVLAYGGGMFWGFGGEVRLTHYPGGWSQAERTMDEQGPGRLLVVPWHLYAVWSFSGGRITADPAASFFSQDVLSASEAGFPQVPAQSPDPFRRYITALLEHRRELQDFGHLVAPLNVRYVAWMHEADWEDYRFIVRQDDLHLLYEDGTISLYENLAWPGPVMPLSAGSSPTPTTNLISTGVERELTKELRAAPPLVPPQSYAFPPLARPLPQWRSIKPVGGAAFLTTGDRCTDGWKLSDEAPLCDLGAVAAFPNPTEIERLWRPVAGARVLGFALSVVALIAIALHVRRMFAITADHR